MASEKHFPIGPDEETDWDSTEATCPHCGEKWQDLWDYEWGSREDIEIDCPFCGETLVLVRVVDVQYYTKHVKDSDQ